MSLPLLKVDSISSSYGPVNVLTKLSIEVKAGELVALVGANGAGKTTLLRCISGVQPISTGHIVFEGRDISPLRADQIVSAGISQSPEGRQVFAPLSVEDNLLLGAYSLRKKKQKTQSINMIYQLFPILEERKTQSAGTLSGGQQQMLAIGRALMAAPKLLLLDEPSMGLAPLLVKEIFSTIKKLNQQGTTVLLVEQNAKMALSIADRGYVIETGKVTLSGDASALLENKAIQRAYLGH
jgi:branched-chain amino acid transport system ATP-binding protein